MNRIGIDLGGTKIEGILLGTDNDVISRKRVPTDQQEGYDSIVSRICQLIAELGGYTSDEYSVGICTPGSISPETGRIRNSNTLCLIDRHLNKDIEDILGHPISMENDANCFAVAEATLGAAEGYRTVFGVIMGTGVGGGIVVDGHIHTGATNIAGEWGHHKISDAGPDCYCGHQGCVESFISGPALERRWTALGGVKSALKDILKSPGHAHFDQWKNEFITCFGRALSNIINILDPDAIVLGGGVSNIPFLYDEGRDAVYKHVFSDYVKTPILKNALGDSAGVFGAALLEE